MANSLNTWVARLELSKRPANHRIDPIYSNLTF